MKVVILCGGKGERLREETEYKPKPLVKIGDMPILWHIMKIYSYYGFKEFVLCLGYRGEMIKDYFLNFEEMANDFTLNLRSQEKRIIHHNENKLEDWKITFVDTGMDVQTGGRIAKIKAFVKNDENFFLTYGDGLSDVNINDLYKFHKDKRKIITILGVHPSTTYGVLEVQGGVAHAFKEKPTLEGMVNGGFFTCNKKIFDYVPDDKECVFEEMPMRRLVDDKKAAVYIHNGYWQCMDNIKQAERLNREYESGKAPWEVWNQ